MTQTESNLYKPKPEGQRKTPHKAPDRNRFEIDLFQKSIEAYKLAHLSNRKYSFAELYQTGTWQKYEARAAALARKHSSRDPFSAYLSGNEHDSWASANSRQSYRSALVRLAAQTVLDLAPGYWWHVYATTTDNEARRQLVRDLKTHLDEETLNQIKLATSALLRADLKKLTGAVEFLTQVPPDPRHKAVEQASTKWQNKSPQPRAEASKKEALYALNRHQRLRAKKTPDYDWRSHFWNRAVLPDRYIDDHRRACIAALMLTGCRSSEFTDNLGVVIRSFERGGQNYLAFEISGAKLAEVDAESYGKGQERRWIEVCCQTSEAMWLFAHVSDQYDAQMAISLAAPTYSQTGTPIMPTERQRRVSTSLGKLVGRLGQIAFPRLKQVLSPYVFRHALSSDLRSGEGRWSSEQIAVILGHQSTRTQSNYGSANTSRGLAGNRAEQIVQVSALSPVRRPKHGHPGAPDRPRPA